MGESIVHMFRKMISEVLGNLSAGSMVQVKDKRENYRKDQITTLTEFCGYQKKRFQE